MSEANELTNKIIHQFYIDGAYAWRQSSVGVYDKKMGQFRAAPKKGVSDILAVYRGTLIAIEVKVGSDRMSDEQIGFQENIKHAKGEVYVAKNFEGFLAWWPGVLTRLSGEG